MINHKVRIFYQKLKLSIIIYIRMSEKVFNRVEKKYLITKANKKQLLKTINKYLHRDSYFKSKVMNIYFDNDNFDLIIQSIDHPIFKEKVRARSYGGYDRVFLEIKTKLHEADLNPGFKRRVMITHGDFEKLVNKRSSLAELAAKSQETAKDIQIAKEIDYLIDHFDLKPQILVMYDRESYKGDDDLRITFDENLSYRDYNLCFNQEKHDKIYFKDKLDTIMEIKAQGSLPLWLVKILSEQHLYPQRFSKIGKIYEKIIKEKNV